MPPEGYFTVSFVERIISQYTTNVSFRSGMTQDSILQSRLEDRDRMYEVQESLSDNSSYRLFPENPLQLGFYLETITTGDSAKTTACVKSF